MRSIFGYDKVQFRTDERLSKSALNRISDACRGGAKQSNPGGRVNPQWQGALTLLQPSIKALRLVESCLAADIRYEISGFEIACDIEMQTRVQALLAQRKFIGSAVLRNGTKQTAVTGESGTTVYFAMRGSKCLNLVVYADRPSKLHGAESRSLVLHIEFRAVGSPMVRDVRVETIADLIALDFNALFARHAVLYVLPTSKTELGKLLGDRRLEEPSGTALRARVDRLLAHQDIYVLGVPSMQQLKLARPDLIPKLNRIEIGQWLEELGESIRLA